MSALRDWRCALNVSHGEKEMIKKVFYSKKAAPYVFILPFVLTVALFWIGPIVNGVLLSFQNVLQDKFPVLHARQLHAGACQRRR